ncbi:MAG: response regulator [Chitinophagaceae bacterium]
MQKLLLLIDDDPDEINIMQNAINYSGIDLHCLWAQTCERALFLMEQVLPDFILIDYNMPKLNGLSCLEQIRNVRDLDNTPVIIYSNFISNETKQTAIAKGATVCIRKPTTLVALRTFITDIVNKDLHELS